MSRRPRVAIYIQHDKAHPDKQEAVCLYYAEQQGMDVVALCAEDRGCVAMIRTGGIGAVVTALDPGADFASDVEAAGGRLFIARDQAEPRVRRDVGALVGRMAKLGMPPTDMAKILEVSTAEISKALLKMRQRPGRRSNRGAGY